MNTHLLCKVCLETKVEKIDCTIRSCQHCNNNSDNKLRVDEFGREFTMCLFCDKGFSIVWTKGLHCCCTNMLIKSNKQISCDVTMPIPNLPAFQIEKYLCTLAI